METQERFDSIELTDKPAKAPQLRVRSDVRSGSDLSTCQMNTQKWKQRYYNAYNQAHARGCV